MLNDLYSFNPATVKWMELSPSGSIPSPRFSMGFISTADGMLYVFGGYQGNGEEREECKDRKVGADVSQRCLISSLIINDS